MRLGLALIALAACNGDGEGTPTTETGAVTDTDDTQTGTTSTGPTRVATILSLTPDLAAGETTYTTLCAACHGADGAGTASGADLAAQVPVLTDEEVVTTIVDGKGNMDSYRFLKNQEIADVAAYVRDSFGQ
jgi:mono/diheme cytochrome c family protein